MTDPINNRVNLPVLAQIALENNLGNATTPRDIVKEIAMDIGKDVVAYIEVMYPEAVKATASTFRLSLRNCIYNQIMAALEVTDEGEIRQRLQDRKVWRRKWKAQWKKIREMA